MCKTFNWRLPRGHAASCSTLISSVCFHWFRVSMQFIHYDELWWKSIWGVNCMIRLYFNKISIKVVSFPKVVIHCCIHSYGWHFSPTFTKRLASFAALENVMRLRQNPAETCRGWTIWGPFCTNWSIHFRANDLILNLLIVVQHTHTHVWTGFLLHQNSQTLRLQSAGEWTEATVTVKPSLAAPCRYSLH